MLGKEDFREKRVFGECVEGQIECLENRILSVGQEGELEGYARQ